jgi:hypothetical protein
MRAAALRCRLTVNIQVTAAGAGSSGVRKDLGELFLMVSRI